MVHAGRYGSTAEVAEVVAEELRRCGATVDASPATEDIRLDAYDAIVVGSAIYWEHLLPEAASSSSGTARPSAASAWPASCSAWS